MSGYWKRDQLGSRCPTCGYRVPLVVAAPYHPTCWPQGEDRA